VDKKTRLVAVMLVSLLIASTVFAREIKDPNPPQTGTSKSVSTPSGGPDSFGYTFADSQEASCQANAIIDISGTGTFVIDGDDTGAPVTLGAPFSFYGANVTQLAMTSNGYLSTDLTDDGPDLSNDCPLPAPPSTGGGGRLYPLHDDLILETGVGSAFYQFFANCPRPSDRCATNEACSVFMWDDVAHFGDEGITWDVNAILYHTTNDIVYIVGAGNLEAGSGSTTGIQNVGATIGLTYACNTAASMPNGRNVCIFNPASVPGSCSPGDVSITKAASEPNVAPGDTVTFVLTASNAGPGAVNNVVVTDILDPALSYVSDDCAATVAAQTVTWNVGSLANGASATCNLLVQVAADATGSISNTATVTADGQDPVTTNNADTIALGVQPDVQGIPTLSTLGLLALVVALAGTALVLMRRSRKQLS
jgi:uncharacterized repeat protein (TIGR01451 family)